MTVPLLDVRGLCKVYSRGLLHKEESFRLEADFRLAEPGIHGIIGPNGSGKTTLFELITGSNLPSSGEVLCCGHNIHRIRPAHRDRLAIHYHQVNHMRRPQRPRFALPPRGKAPPGKPRIHLYDEPQFDPRDGLTGLLLDYYKRLRDDGCLVMLCLHPESEFHLNILKDICESFYFVNAGRVTPARSYQSLLTVDGVSDYLGDLAAVQA